MNKKRKFLVLSYLEVVQEKVDLPSVHEGVSTGRLQLESGSKVRQTEYGVVDGVLAALDVERASLDQGVHFDLLLTLRTLLDNSVQEFESFFQLFCEDQKSCFQQFGLQSVGSIGGYFFIAKRDDLIKVLTVVALLCLAVMTVTTELLEERILNEGGEVLAD